MIARPGSFPGPRHSNEKGPLAVATGLFLFQYRSMKL